MENNDVDVAVAQLAPIQYNDISLGIRSAEWVRYAHIVDEGNPMFRTQQRVVVGGHDVVYGQLLDELDRKDKAMSQQPASKKRRLGPKSEEALPVRTCMYT